MSVSVLNGDCREFLATLDAESVQTCVTSPPYFGLRDYGVAGQIGVEKQWPEYVAELVAVFRAVRRVLRNDGTLWLNLGDSYATGAGAVGSAPGGGAQGEAWKDRGAMTSANRMPQPSMKPKDLMLIPARVAIALQEDGWYVRSDIIWHKPNPMPESVTDRPTKAHEYLFLLSKSERYFYDAAAIAESVAESSIARLSQDVEAQEGSDRVPGKTNGTMKAVGMRPQLRRAMQLAEEHGLTDEHMQAIRACGISDSGKALTTTDGAGKNTPRMQALAAEAKLALGGYYREFLIPQNRNKRTVWTVPTMPFKGAHFATFPPALIEPCILAGSKPGDTVLDPFGGAGTTGLVADRLGRNAVLIELNPAYATMARARIHDDAPLFTGASA